MTPLLKSHKKLEKIFSIRLFLSLSVLLRKVKFASVVKKLLSKNGVHHGIHFHSSKSTVQSLYNTPLYNMYWILHGHVVSPKLFIMEFYK